ncbi:MAG: hypothetical protein ABSA59_24190 [Terriglobia bacterium]
MALDASGDRHSHAGVARPEAERSSAIKIGELSAAAALTPAPESRAPNPNPSPAWTGPWHYIDIGDSKIDFARQCPNSGCVIAKAQ